ncbi:helix-turn-helix domain-containing protein [Lamprobacter modestohalophilus]|uniref:helix-turn-helix domain-containing protein n=1 Tax=Lamprobacter modestohalophilus TaxID=1064514 RepID=UPI002ADEFA81|nr:helix-turn-helix domain-containing protein [Lamprobacter modestohalophilus]MEA1053616.1 helix-turn-helix domain-containing protein [Lamprobacter modestohalophilus]
MQLALRLPGAAEPEASTDVVGLKAHAHAGERAAILAALDDQERNVTAAAAALGVSRKTLWQKMKRYGISR